MNCLVKYIIKARNSSYSCFEENFHSNIKNTYKKLLDRQFKLLPSAVEVLKKATVEEKQRIELARARRSSQNNGSLQNLAGDNV